MDSSSKSDSAKMIKSEYNKRLKELESRLALKHKELKQIENELIHDTKKIDHSNVGKLKSQKAEINAAILLLKKEIKKVSKERTKKLKKL